MKKEIKEKTEETVVKERSFCPVCGSTEIRPALQGGFRCMNCDSIFPEPKKAAVEIPKKPKYAG